MDFNATVIKSISIHALREEGDSLTASVLYRVSPFLSTPSARRAPLVRSCKHSRQDSFLSTPSARRAT